eukprot:Partr_v1_DN24240_c0_g1_i2_m36856 putative GPN-loop GTPase 3
MGRFVQLVIGPAGSGKSTYCNVLQKHFQTIRRPAITVNLDPAAEKLHHEPSIDIRDLISVPDVMEELQLGPNGGLMFCMEYFMDNIEWFEDELGTDFEEEYLIIDCPGQIELYTHSNIMQQFVRHLQNRMNFHVCVVYLLESQFIVDTSKFFSGVLTAISSMVQLEVPHVNILSKMDLIEGRPGSGSNNTAATPEDLARGGTAATANSGNDPTTTQRGPEFLSAMHPDEPQQGMADTWTEEEEFERDRRRDMVNLEHYLDPAPRALIDSVSDAVGGDKWKNLNRAMVQLIEDFDMVQFLPLNIHDEASIEAILYSIDNATQFAEDQEPRERRGDDEDNDEENENASYQDIVERTWESIME